MSPLIILPIAIKNYDFNKLNFLDLKFKNFVKNIFSIAIIIQLMMFFVSALYSISLTLFTIYDYEKGMNKTAYNFFNSKKIEELASFPVYSEVTGMTHLFFDKPFIANQKFEKCFYYGENIANDQKYKNCMIQNGVKTIIVKNNKLKNSSYFDCRKNYLKRVSRNIFLEKNIEVDFCKLK